MNSSENQTIEVHFYEGKGSTPFAVSNIPVDQLPDTFEINTVMHLGQDDWQVTAAEPAQKSTFKTTGKLDLYLTKREVLQMDPQEILYSLPTINHELPEVQDIQSLENIAIFHEDDWRQFEFVAQEYESLIEDEFDGIDKIYENYSKGSAFKHLHLRKSIAKPLQNNKLTLDSLENYFKIIKKYDGVTFQGYAAVVVDGFAFQIEGGWLLWGQLAGDGNIATLNLAQMQEANVPAISNIVDLFLGKNKLFLIDWPTLFWFGKDKCSFSEYE